MKAITLAGLLLLFLTSGVGAQRRCVKGIPCGGTCISASKTCRIGQTPPPRDTSSSSGTFQPYEIDAERQRALVARVTGDTGAKTPAEFGPFVGSVDGNVYYAIGCNTSWKLTPEERIYFKSEQEAIAKGYHRSRAKNC